MNKERKLHVTAHRIDKKNHHINYYTDVIGLYIDTFYDNDAGYINFWEAADSEQYWRGTTIEELLSFLADIISYYKPVKKDDKVIYEDVIVIYTDNIFKVGGFLQKFITNIFGEYYFRFGCIEFRDIKSFGGSIQDIRETLKDDFSTEAYLIKDFTQQLVDTVFVPEKNFYITPNQRVHKILSNNKKINNVDVKAIAPNDFYDYTEYRKAYFGGLCYSGLDTIYEDMVMFDRKSAYIYDMIIEKHCMSKSKIVKPYNWLDYVNNTSKLSVGKYHIKAYLSTGKAKGLMRCFKNYNGNKFKYVDLARNKYILEDDYVLTSIDVANIIKIVGEDYLSIKCIWLNEYVADDLPEYFLDTAVELYINKERISKLYKEGKTSLFDKTVSKQSVNGLYGSCAKRRKTVDEYKYYRNHDCTDVIQWALFITSYAKKNLLDLSLQLNDWVYSDTDCLVIKDTPENRVIIEAYNEKCRAKIKAFCDKYGYNYDDLKDLGCFMEDKKMPYFKNIGVKQYMWHDEDYNFHLKAAGLDQDSIEIIEEDWWNGKVTYGKHKFPHWTSKTTTTIKDNKTYISYGSYYETEEYINDDNIDIIIESLKPKFN